jgi:hypothetical protein
VESLPPGPRALSRHAAHNSIFFLFPAFLGLNPVPRLERFWSFPTFPPRSWHVPCWATLSKIRFEGTKKPIGWFAEAGTAIDVPSLGRPSSWRPAKLIARTRTRQPISITFLRFFSENSQVVDLQWVFSEFQAHIRQKPGQYLDSLVRLKATRAMGF